MMAKQVLSPGEPDPANLAERLREANQSCSNWRNGVDDSGPSGAARALHLYSEANNAAARIEQLEAEIAKLRRENERMRIVVVELAESKPEWQSGRHPSDPQLDMPDLVDAATFYALQSDARMALETTNDTD